MEPQKAQDWMEHEKEISLDLESLNKFPLTSIHPLSRQEFYDFFIFNEGLKHLLTEKTGRFHLLSAWKIHLFEFDRKPFSSSWFRDLHY